MNIIIPSTGMQSKPFESSELETECLFGESVNVLDENLDWVYCKLLTDNYNGWVSKKALGFIQKPTHRVQTTRSFLFEEKNIKSNVISHLPMGSLLSVIMINGNWATVKLPSFYNLKTAHVPKNHIVNVDYRTKDWVKVAEQLLNTPYKWGGRDTLGIDCSALLQLSYQTYGENIPRNTSQQLELQKKVVVNIDDLERGCVIFWTGHVGIMTNNLYCIHANAYHMKTKIEPLSKIIERMGEDSSIIKMMNFN